MCNTRHNKAKQLGCDVNKKLKRPNNEGMSIKEHQKVRSSSRNTKRNIKRLNNLGSTLT